MKRVVVVGLGIFGRNVVRQLFENGAEVIAIDKDKDAVQQVKDISSKAIVADGTERELWNLIGIQESDVVIVSFGDDLAPSTLITLALRQNKVRTIIVKAPNEEYKLILEKVGATEVIIPEQEMATKVVKGLISPNVLDYLPLSDEYMISEVVPPSDFLDRSIADLQLRGRFQVEVIAVRDAIKDTLRMVPGADFVIRDGHVLVVLGKEADIARMT